MSEAGYKLMAKAFRAEGVEQVFTLIGDANMHWVTQIAAEPGVRIVHALHEHAACTMADAYARATGKVGAASVTSGPGFTQIMTALVAAARGSVPMVILAGDTPSNAAYHMQQIDQAALTVATGAHFIGVRHVDRLLDSVRDAFHVARSERRPVVLSVPVNLQKAAFPWDYDYRASTDYLPRRQHAVPDPALIEELADMVQAAARPILIGGRGALRSGAGPQMEQLADQCGALLATTLLGKGLFCNHAFSLGIAGAFADSAAREEFAQADLVIAVGASLTSYTTEAGYLFPDAKVVQIDLNPRGLNQGMRTADLHLRAGALTAVTALGAVLSARGHSPRGRRSPELAERIAAAAALPDARPYVCSPGTVDPRAILREIDRVVPKDWDVVIGGGHYFGIALTHLQGREASRYHVVNDFGAIGSALPAAIGVACARGSGKVLLIEGDGSLLMHIQELDTLRRMNLQMLVCVVNDGGYGAEFHKLRAEGFDASQAVHGRRDFASIARGFGLRGATVNSGNQLKELFDEHAASPVATVWDLHVDDMIPSAAYRRVHYGQIDD
ncbi:MAG: thiamine pyrophosphate-binding protein [Burkholderiaceae bacterium]|nr:thiamine pyrophosphate-binding protein [Burkholderiaceae bacterium]